MREDITKTKLNKLDKLAKAGMDTYPQKVRRDFSNGEALKNFSTLAEKEIHLAGRVRSLRIMGGSVFAHIEDGSGKIQIFAKKDNLKDGNFELFVDAVEIGDFIEVSGKLFTTKKGEKTLEIFSWRMLTKSLRPIPTEFYGLKDTEELLRKRYLDLLLNPETREIFRKKVIFWNTIRQYLTEKGFLEVQTPVLEEIPGGAEAKPFKTYHNALGQDLYLRISLELPLKKLLVGGLEKVFEIGRVFRNEGIDRGHLQEYDHVEFYWAYADLEAGMEMVEDLYKKVVEGVTGGLDTEYEGNKIKWAGDWPKIEYFDEFKKATSFDLNEEISVEQLRKKADELDIKYEKEYGKGRMIDTLYKKAIRNNLVKPCFLIGHPIDVSPLAKKDPQNPKKVLRVQPIACGTELGNGFSELNDPQEQKKRFEEQMKLRKAGDEEAQMMDEDFIEALEYGMPPAFGFGLSERLFAVIMNKSIRETVIFPPMKSK